MVRSRKAGTGTIKTRKQTGKASAGDIHAETEDRKEQDQKWKQRRRDIAAGTQDSVKCHQTHKTKREGQPRNSFTPAPPCHGYPTSDKGNNRDDETVGIILVGQPGVGNALKGTQ